MAPERLKQFFAFSCIFSLFFCIIFFLIFLWREDCMGFEKKINRKKLIQSEFIRTQLKISYIFQFGSF